MGKLSAGVRRRPRAAGRVVVLGVLAGLTGLGAGRARAEVPPDLAAARIEAEAWPGDYAAQVALARAAEAAGAPQEALAAWGRAAELSGGNLETTLGPVPALVSLGRYGQAQAAAGDGLSQAPDLASAWMLGGWAVRFRPWLPDLAAHQAVARYRRASQLAPTDAGAWCGLGWTRIQAGNTRGARAALDRAGGLGDAAGCAVAGLEALPPRWTVDAVLLGGGSAWSGHPWRDGGLGGTAQVAASFDSLVALDVTARRLHIAEVATGGAPDGQAAPDGFQPLAKAMGPMDGSGSGPGPGGDPTAPATQAEGAGDMDQAELWGRAVLGHAGHGVQLVAGRVTTAGRAETGASVVGGRAWITHGLSLLAEAAGTTYDDGATQSQVGGGLVVPLWRALRVEGGALSSTVGGDVGDDALAGTGLSGWGAVAWGGPDTAWSGRLVGRAGSERRPVRLDEPSVWNVDDELRVSGQLVLGWRPLPWLDVRGGTEWARFQTFYPPGVVAADLGLDETSDAWLFFAGVGFRPVGARSRRGE